jgi:hypothetical protein
MSKNLWERRVVVANERIAQLEAQIIERDATHARLQTENARLVEKEKAAREAKASLDANVAKLKVCLFVLGYTGRLIVHLQGRCGD